MQDLNDKATGNSLSADEWNQVPSEIQNVIESQGIALSGADLNQLGKAIAGYIANGQFYTDSGTANAYVLTKIGSRQRAPSYTVGFTVNFIAANSNTGSSVVNVDGIGSKIIKTLSGSSLPSGAIRANANVTLRYNGADFILITPLDKNSAYVLPNSIGNISRQVMQTATGGTGVEDGANTWAELLTITPSIVSYTNFTAKYEVYSYAGDSQPVATINLVLRQQTLGLSVAASRIEVTSISGIGLGYDSFKITQAVAENGSPIKLWIKKTAISCRFHIQEILLDSTNWSIAYNDGAVWQSATPSGAVNILSDWATQAGAPTISGYKAITAQYIQDTSLGNKELQIDPIVTENTWESVGPTGSGATNIWSALDVMPTNAKTVRLGGYALFNANAQTANCFIYGRPTGSVTAKNNTNIILYHSVTDGTSTAHPEIDVQGFDDVVLDSNRRFDILWYDGGSSFTVEQFYIQFKGFGV